MLTVGVRELKARLSHYLRQVQAGRAVRVTRHGEVVAVLGRPEPSQAGSVRERLLDLERQGRCRTGEASAPALYAPAPPTALPEGWTVQRLLDDARGER